MRVLILGGTGMIGHKLWQTLSLRFPEAYVTVRDERAALARYGTLYAGERVLDRVDVADFERLRGTLDTVQPEVIVNCVGVTKRQTGAGDPVASLTLNSLLPQTLAAWSRPRGTRVIHFSTDCVFDGLQGGYTEESFPSARDLYGRTKALGEITGDGALTLRTSMIGREVRQRTELLEWFLAQEGKRIKGFRQALYTGVSTRFMAGVVGEIIERFPGLSGLYQVTSEVITKYDLLLLAREAFGLDVEIDPDDDFVCKRDLVGDRFRQATGLICPPWPEMMADLAQDPTPYDSWR
jgi:dTDP-4-dehydrorhamnose reductase